MIFGALDTRHKEKVVQHFPGFRDLIKEFNSDALEGVELAPFLVSSFTPLLPNVCPPWADLLSPRLREGSP